MHDGLSFTVEPISVPRRPTYSVTSKFNSLSDAQKQQLLDFLDTL